MRWIVPFLGLSLPAVAAAQQGTSAPTDQRTVSVEATASVEQPPERAMLTLAVENQEANAQAAAQANAQVMTRLVAALKPLGVSGSAIRTVSYSLQPVYEQPDRARPQAPPRIVAYRALNMVGVTVEDVGQVGRAIDAAVAAGANRIAGLTFALRDYEAARLEALRQAVRKAQRQAEVAAEAAGQRLGPPVSIRTTDGERPVVPLAESLRFASAAPTPVEAGSLTVSVTVHIDYRLENR